MSNNFVSFFSCYLSFEIKKKSFDKDLFHLDSCYGVNVVRDMLDLNISILELWKRSVILYITELMHFALFA